VHGHTSASAMMVSGGKATQDGARVKLAAVHRADEEHGLGQRSRPTAQPGSLVCGTAIAGACPL
jgi:hypothetical protein